MGHACLGYENPVNWSNTQDPEDAPEFHFGEEPPVTVLDIHDETTEPLFHATSSFLFNFTGFGSEDNEEPEEPEFSLIMGPQHVCRSSSCDVQRPPMVLYLEPDSSDSDM